MSDDTGTKPSSYLTICVVMFVALWALSFAYTYADQLNGFFKLPMPK